MSSDEGMEGEKKHMEKIVTVLTLDALLYALCFPLRRSSRGVSRMIEREILRTPQDKFWTTDFMDYL